MSQQTQTVFVTGASSGLGLAFVRHYACQPTTRRIIALDITEPPARSYGTGTAPIEFWTASVTNTSLHELAALHASTPINVLIHCAGVRGLVKTELERQAQTGEPGDVAAAETLEVMDQETMMKTFEINTFGTYNVIKSFLPNLMLARYQNPAENPKVVIMSSRMGSVSSNTSGGGYAYRASKAALNAVVKSFSIDVPEVIFLMLHPGRVETGLVGWREEGAIHVYESVSDCFKVIEIVQKADSGILVDRFGKTIPW